MVQFLTWGLFWRSVRGTCAGAETTSTMVWDTYASAQAWVKEVGLDQAFSEQQQKNRPTFIYGQGATR